MGVGGLVLYIFHLKGLLCRIVISLFRDYNLESNNFKIPEVKLLCTTDSPLNHSLSDLPQTSCACAVQ